MMIALPSILKEAFVTAGGHNTLIPQFNDRYSAGSVARMFYRDLPSLPLIIPEGSNCTKFSTHQPPYIASVIFTGGGRSGGSRLKSQMLSAP